MTTQRLSKLSRSIAGKVAIVTGAASGMGRATAHLFADEGARVAVLDRSADGVEKVVGEITSAGGTARVGSSTCPTSRRSTMRWPTSPSTSARIDILINNAGVSLGAPIDSPQWEESWAATIAINLTAQGRMVRAALPHLRAAGDARIVNIASTEGLGATAGGSSYTASKHGVVGLTRSLAVQLGREGITVNCICPGPIRTGMTAAIPEEHKTKFARRRVPLRRYAEPEEVAHATLSFVLPAASFITGAVLPVDGGLRVQNT